MNKEEQARKLLYTLTDVDDEFVAESGEAVREPARCGHTIPFRRAIRYAAAVAACFAVVLIASHFFNTNHDNISGQEEILIDANPFDETTTLAEAEKIAGFAMQVPEAVQPYDKMSVTVVDGSLIEVRYMTSDESDTGYDIRKAAGENDVSGDYSEYDNETVVTIGEKEVTLKGDGDRWSVATWTADGYSYALGAQYYPMTLEEITALIEKTE